jgi:hypothetical protein
MSKILDFAIISTGLLLSSCSVMNRGANTPSLRQIKLETGQQLNVYSKASEKPIDCTEADTYCPRGYSTQNIKPYKVAEQTDNHEYKRNSDKDFSKENGLKKRFELKLNHGVRQLLKAPAYTASLKSIEEAEPATFLVLWIVFLLAAILFGYLAIVSAVGAALLTAVLFYVLAILASFLAIIFFIVWIIQLAKGVPDARIK